MSEDQDFLDIVGDVTKEWRMDFIRRLWVAGYLTDKEFKDAAQDASDSKTGE